MRRTTPISRSKEREGARDIPAPPSGSFNVYGKRAGPVDVREDLLQVPQRQPRKKVLANGRVPPRGQLPFLPSPSLLPSTLNRLHWPPSLSDWRMKTGKYSGALSKAWAG